jgi:DNA-binding response OmpR family regulator
MRALVIEDTPDLARLVQRVLLLEGFKVEIAADGAAALASVRDVPPDLIILDLKLPDIDGREICRRVRAADEAAGRSPTPILGSRPEPTTTCRSRSTSKSWRCVCAR